MIQVPAVMEVTVLPLTLQILAVVELKLNESSEVEVAEILLVPPIERFVTALNVIT